MSKLCAYILILLPLLGLKAADPVVLAQGIPTVGGEATGEPLTVVDGPVEAGITVRVPAQRSGDLFKSEARMPVASAVPAGHGITVRAWVRLVSTRSETGQGMATLYLQKTGSPWTKYIAGDLPITNTWKEITLGAVMQQAFPESGTEISFHLSHAEQVLELGPVTVEDHGPMTDATSLPLTRFTYRGRELDAPWRALAEERIDRLRKSNLQVRVVDRAGNLIPGAQVKVEQVRVAFQFGSAVSSRFLIDGQESDRPGKPADRKRYLQEMKRLFNTVTIENDLKWPVYDEPAGKKRALAALDVLTKEGLDVRGHCLVWPSLRYLPKRLAPLVEARDATALRTEIANRIQQTAGGLAGRLVHWDVLNEPYANRDLQAVLGDEEMAEWFRAAHAADPKALLFLNDYNILNGIFFDYYVTLARKFLDQGAPLQGLGIQEHWGVLPADMDRIQERWERLGELKLPVVVTEYDMNTVDGELQADYLRDMLTQAFAAPACTGFIMWGFWEGNHWIPRAALWRSDWTQRPAAKVWEDLVLNRWRTSRSMAATDGTAALRAFRGTLRITAQVGDRTAQTTVDLGDRETTATITVNPKP